MRAQTTLDFAAGVSVFLITVALVFTFLPGLIDPFVGIAQGDPVVANRAAAALAEGELGDAENPYILDTDEVDAFFTAAANDQTYVRTRLGLDATADVNITLRDQGSVLRQVGPPPSNTQDVAVAWRVVRYRGDRAELIVKVW